MPKRRPWLCRSRIRAPISPGRTPSASCGCWRAAPFPRRHAHYVSSTGIEPSILDVGAGGRARRRIVRAWSAPHGSTGQACSSGSATHAGGRSHPFAQIRNEENCLLINTGQSDVATRLDGPRRRTLADHGRRDGRSVRPEPRTPRAHRHDSRRASRARMQPVQLTTDDWPLATTGGAA